MDTSQETLYRATATNGRFSSRWTYSRLLAHAMARGAGYALGQYLIERRTVVDGMYRDRADGE